VNKQAAELLSRTPPRIILKAGVGVMCSRREALATGLLAILLGLANSSCSDTGAGSDAAGTSAPTTTSETTSEPSPEPTDPETSQSTQRKPSINLASAPIGGNVDANDNFRCAEVNWLGRSPIPAGTTIYLGRPHLARRGVFVLDQDGCPPDARSCAKVRWASGNFRPCYVGARQVAAGSRDVSLIIPVTAVCATDEDCQSLVGDAGGSQLAFSPGDFSPTPSDG
jgi:hypothetical protein